MKTQRRTTLATLAAVTVSAVLSLGAALSQAAVIHSIDGGGTQHAFTAMDYVGKGEIVEDGFTWSSTSKHSVYGYTGSYGLGKNGGWNGPALSDELGPYIGLNTGNNANKFMTITFDNPVSSVLAYLNYAPYHGKPFMAIYDINNNLIEQAYLRLSTPHQINQGEDWGFSQSTAIIKSFVLGNAFIVAANLRTDGPHAEVPEPQSIAMLCIGLLGLVGVRRMQKA